MRENEQRGYEVRPEGIQVVPNVLRLNTGDKGTDNLLIEKFFATYFLEESKQIDRFTKTPFPATYDIQFNNQETASSIVQSYRREHYDFNILDAQGLTHQAILSPFFHQKYTIREKNDGINYHRLVVSNLSQNYTRKEIYSLFEKFGNCIEAYTIIGKRGTSEEHSHLSVLFETEKSAQNVIKHYCNDPTVLVEYFNRNRTKRGEELSLCKDGVKSMPRVDLEEFFV